MWGSGWHSCDVHTLRNIPMHRRLRLFLHWPQNFGGENRRLCRSDCSSLVNRKPFRQSTQRTTMSSYKPPRSRLTRQDRSSCFNFMIRRPCISKFLVMKMLCAGVFCCSQISTTISSSAYSAAGPHSHLQRNLSDFSRQSHGEY